MVGSALSRWWIMALRRSSQGGVCLAPKRSLLPGNHSPERWFCWPCESSTTGSLPHHYIDVDSYTWLYSLHCPLWLQKTALIWLCHPDLASQNAVCPCYSASEAPSCHHIIVWLAVPFHRLHNQVTERLDDNTEKVSCVTKSLDTVCVLCTSYQQAERGRWHAVFLKWKRKRNLKCFKEWFTMKL